MILTGNEIEKRMALLQIVIEPFDRSQLNPNSYNLTLHPEISCYGLQSLDSRKDNPVISTVIPETGYRLKPGKVYIARTNEWTETYDLIPMLNGRSSLGRLGMFVHVTAGFGDIGFKGTWTLELVVVQPLIIYPNMKIAQIYYHEPIGDTGIVYDGKYQGQVDATASRLFKEY